MLSWRINATCTELPELPALKIDKSFAHPLRHRPEAFMNNLQRYRLVCTLSFGDVYSQIIVWLLVIFLSLAAAMAMMGASRPVYALATVGLILVLSLPFLLFAFVTTLLNHIEVREVDIAAEKAANSNSVLNQQQPAATT
jgi:hypothetical protein